MAVNA
jgi:hypothetical protein